MSYEIDSSFARVDQILPFLHICFVVFLVGAKISLIVMGEIFKKNPPKYLSNFFKFYNTSMAIIFALLILSAITGYLITLSSDFKFSDPMVESAVMTKLIIVLFMICNLYYSLYRANLAKKAFIKKEFDEMVEHFTIAIKYFVTLNVILILLTIYLGVVIRNFL